MHRGRQRREGCKCLEIRKIERFGEIRDAVQFPLRNHCGPGWERIDEKSTKRESHEKKLWHLLDGDRAHGKRAVTVEPGSRI